MKIAINATSSVAGGGVTYMKNLLTGLSKTGATHQYVVLTTAAGREKFYFPHPRFTFLSFKIPSLSPLLRLCWEQTFLAVLLRRLQVDALFSPANIAPLFSRIPNVVMIQNIEPFGNNVSVRCGLLSGIRLRLLRWLTILSIKKSQRVIFPSVKAHSVVERFGVSLKHAEVVYHGICGKMFHPFLNGDALLQHNKTAHHRGREEYAKNAEENGSFRICEKHEAQSINPLSSEELLQPFIKDEVTMSSLAPVHLPRELLQKKYGLDRFILFVSNIRRYKNFLELIRAFALLRGKIDDRIQLIFAGGCHDAVYYQELLSFIREQRLESRIIFLGDVPYEYLPYLYAGCMLFVYPSTCESFGMTMVEAMSCGAPILASNREPMPEICGDAAKYFDPMNPAAIAEALFVTINNADVLSTMRTDSIKRAQHFSWENTASRVLNILEGVVKNKR